MNIKEKYNLWLTFDENTKKELESVTDEKEIEDRFYKDLECYEIYNGRKSLSELKEIIFNRFRNFTETQMVSPW